MADEGDSLAENVILFAQTLGKVVTIIVWSIVKSLLPSSFVHRKSVAGETILITGAGSGIGQQLAERFAKLGARLVLWDINEEGNAETKRIIQNIGSEVFTYTVDLSKREDIYRTAERVKQDVGHIDILINNAGIVFGKKIMDSSDEKIQKTMDVNTLSHFFTTKAFLGPMIEANHGHIVEIASMAGKTGVSSMTDYCASKHAVIGFAESLVAELRSMKLYGVHVTTICPFFIATGMFEGVRSCSVMLPILTPEYVVDQTVEAVLTDTEIVLLPKACTLIMILQSILPTEAAHVLSDYYRTNRYMESYVGRTVSTK